MIMIKYKLQEITSRMNKELFSNNVYNVQKMYPENTTKIQFKCM